ncbi:MAG: 4Fe-4S binding protein [Candidatus Aenigmatarchaeota archaeon]|nr:4Fe-4S binding protein [Candidatus Aenigmarchaeota archaeon]
MGWNINKNKCLRCGACVSVCPKIALELSEHGIENNKNLCNLCGICEKICPVGAIKVNKNA